MHVKHNFLRHLQHVDGVLKVIYDEIYYEIQLGFFLFTISLFSLKRSNWISFQIFDSLFYLNISETSMTTLFDTLPIVFLSKDISIRRFLPHNEITIVDNDKSIDELFDRYKQYGSNHDNGGMNYILVQNISFGTSVTKRNTLTFFPVYFSTLWCTHSALVR